MRVGVNTLFLIPGEVGGSETYTCQVLRAIAEHHSAIDLVLFTNVENHDQFQRQFGNFDQVQLVRIALRAENRYSRIVREQLELPWAVRRAQLDVLWSPGYTAPGFVPCPQVVTIFDMQYKSYPEDLAPLALRATDVLVRLAARRCRRVLTMSDFGKSEILHYTGARADRIDVTPGAADRSFGEPLDASERQCLLRGLLGGTAPYLFYVGNTYPHKNAHGLVEAFGRLAGQLPHNLVLLGRPRRGEPLVESARNQLDDPRRVIRLFQATPTELRALYQGADLFVLPSMYEGFGLPVLEAMMSKVPVLAARRASIPEVGGQNIAYFDPVHANALVAGVRDVLRMPAAEKELRVADAFKRAASFTWARTASQTVMSLESAVSPG